MSTENIHPIFDSILKKEDKEKLLGQKGLVLWMTGLSGSGKSTLATGLENLLHQNRNLSQLLDGDNLRTGLNNNLGFSVEDRTENIRRVSETAKLFCDCGIITICSFISPTAEIRQQAKVIIGSENFVEVYINTPLEECEKRDVKGLYKKARAGEIKGFTGIDSPFEAPENATIEIKTKDLTIEESVEILYKEVLKRIKRK